MLTLNEYCRREFGEKLYKLSLDAGLTCPVRDGNLDTRGCIFCSKGGSGDFAASSDLPVDRQIEEAKKLVAGKFKGNRYIAYFQSYTNTYAPAERLRELFMPVIRRDDIAVLSIATRPDCLGIDSCSGLYGSADIRGISGKNPSGYTGDGILSLIRELNRVKPVWIELGLQTSNENSAAYIRRRYHNDVYEKAVRELNAIGVHVVTHIILGLPGETTDDMLASVRFAVNAGTKGIKLQLLHVLEGTDLASDYRNGAFNTLGFEEYLSLLSECLKILPEDMVVHRLTGDGPKRLLIAPMWSADKKRVINAVRTLIQDQCV